jgi:hypothetical protein
LCAANCSFSVAVFVHLNPLALDALDSLRDPMRCISFSLNDRSREKRRDFAGRINPFASRVC